MSCMRNMAIALSLFANNIISTAEDRIFHLDFNGIGNIPLKPLPVPNTAPQDISLTVNDSISICKGVTGSAILMRNCNDSLEIKSKSILSPSTGALAFWMNLHLEVTENIDFKLFEADFPKGKFTLNKDFNFAVADKNSKWSSPGKGNFSPFNLLENGRWVFIVLNWDSQKRLKQCFLDAKLLSETPYSPPEGNADKITFSLIAGNNPGNASYVAIDEISIYDRFLAEAEINSLFKSVAQANAGRPPETLEFPNLLKGKQAFFAPEPNYTYKRQGLPDVTCNSPDNNIKLSDGVYSQAGFTAKSSVGWNGVTNVKIDYDIGQPKKIDIMGANLGGTIGKFPEKIIFQLGLEPDNFTFSRELLLSRDYPCENPKRWTNRLVSISGISAWARFIRMEFTTPGALFVDELFVIEENAKGEFKQQIIRK